MTEKEYQYVHTIAQFGSFTAAAEALYISQPSLTQAIHRMEEDYGAIFFTRGRNGIALTKAGQAFLASGEKILSLYDEMRDNIARSTPARSEKLNVGIDASMGGATLVSFWEKCKRMLPNTELSLLEGTSAELEKALSKGKIDLIFTYHQVVKSDFSYVVLHQEELYLATAADETQGQELSDKHTIMEVSAAALETFRYVIPPAGSKVREIIEEIFSFAAISPNIYLATKSFFASLSLAERGVAAMFLSESNAAMCIKNFRIKLFRFPAEWNPYIEIIAAYPSNRILTADSLNAIRAMQEAVTEDRRCAYEY